MFYPKADCCPFSYDEQKEKNDEIDVGDDRCYDASGWMCFNRYKL